MIMDELLEFADATAITAGAGTNLIGDVVDLGSATNRDIGQGEPIYLVIQVSTTFASGTSFQFILASDSTAAISTDGTETRHYISDVFAEADLVAGFQLVVPLPTGDVANSVTPYERYLGILGVGVGTHTAGNVNAFLTKNPIGWRSYPDATN